MQAKSNDVHLLFADTGVQYVCVPLPSNLRFSGEQLGRGWQRCRCVEDGETKDYYYVQWQIVPGQGQLFLAVDTTAARGEEDGGHFCKASALGGDFSVTLQGLLGADDKPLEGLEPVELTIRPSKVRGGEPKDVHLIIDFGNSRTGALLLEFRGDVALDPLMIPLQLINRFHLDAWDEKGDIARQHAGWWYSSKSHWCTTPFLDPPQIEKVVYDEPDEEKDKGGLFSRRKKPTARTMYVTPQTFQDLSMVRMGREADDLSTIMDTDGEVRTGVSSPKRYLWAKDASWLEGANWHMADPHGKHDAERHATTLQGPLLKFFPEDDDPDDPEPKYDENPSKPRHAPRILMAGALYEIFCQAYTFINSATYRRTAGERDRMRRLRSVTLTFPSGMIAPERDRLEKQARKAIRLFCQTLGKAQDLEPDLHLSIDEASAVHLTYIWSEVQKLGKKPSLWFRLMGRKQGPQLAEDKEEESEEQPATETEAKETARPAPRRRGGARPRRAGRRAKLSEATPSGQDLPEVRVACLDIGGGTSDLMIAKYTCEARAGGDKVLGETLHRDGIYLAGDHLVKRLLECIIIPLFADVVGLEDQDVKRLFGPEIAGWNSEFRAQRINWINRLFVPLAQAYLECAVDHIEDDEISHTDPEFVAPEVVESLQRTINDIWGPGQYNVNQPLGLYYVRDEFEDVVYEVFDDLLIDFCETIIENRADVVLLAGQPTKLEFVQDLVQTYLPMPKSRIIPMYNRYVGTWYPYQNPDEMNPGVIVDPKSTVVVGAATEFSARYGMLGQFKFAMSDEAAKRSYYWGVMTESRIDTERILFRSLENEEVKPAKDEYVLNVSDRRLVIGRKRRGYENAQASPVYLIKIDLGGQMGEIDVNVTLERTIGDDGEEKLEITAVDGSAGDQPAELGKNVLFEWRTLTDERYYLDTGGLDKIELGQ